MGTWPSLGDLPAAVSAQWDGVKNKVQDAIDGAVKCIGNPLCMAGTVVGAVGDGFVAVGGAIGDRADAVGGVCRRGRSC